MPYKSYETLYGGGYVHVLQLATIIRNIFNRAAYRGCGGLKSIPVPHIASWIPNLIAGAEIYRNISCLLRDLQLVLF